MTQALIVGPRDQLRAAVEMLYELKILQILDHEQGRDDLPIGTPLPDAADSSELLVKLRSVASVLQLPIEPSETPPRASLDQLRDRILSLDMSISEEDASRKKGLALLAELARRIADLTPIAALPLRLEDYRGYDNLEVMVGSVSEIPEGIDQVTTEYEMFEAAGILAVFVAKRSVEAIRTFLASHGFIALAVPDGEGRPGELIASLRIEEQKWQKRVTEIDKRLSNLHDRHAEFVAAAADYLESKVEKAEAPLRFAITDHTFIAEGWVPTADFEDLHAALDKIPGAFVDKIGDSPSHEDPAKPPVLVRHIRAFRPFQTLVNQFGTPSYREVDPTFVLATIFPLFFGLMVGDAGYGAVWVLWGVWLIRRRRWKGRFWKDVVTAITWGGVASLLFGLFVFGEAFGIPFHAPAHAVTRAAMFNWSDNILGITIPLYPILEKLSQVGDFLVLSVFAAYLHLSAGFVIGIANEVRHSRKHLIGKTGWLILLNGMFFIILVRAARWPGLGRGLWNTVFAWIPHGGIAFPTLGFTGTNPLPIAGLALFAVGLVAVLGSEGAYGLLEVITLLSNVMSYARLAAIGVAEEAVIFALNGIFFAIAIFPFADTRNILYLLAGIAMLVPIHIILFLLVTLSGTIQSVRLHYVEFFIKFFQGTGTSFRPFGVKAISEV